MTSSKVKAVYDYTKQNTDELSFKRGDIITISQQPLDGWYEGTLKGLTGWLPANYVVEYVDEIANRLSTDLTEENRLKVMTNIIETEAAFVKDLDVLLNSHLQPIWRTFGDNYDLLNRNLEVILERHRALLSGIRAESNQSSGKFGKVFIANFNSLQAVHSSYCSLHPKIVKSLMITHTNNNNKWNMNSLNNNNGSSILDITKLTIGLSSPFKRVERYETLLGELTRHTAENHADRGDCQRSCHLYRELAVELTKIRRQKDIETEILNSSIRNWDGPSIATFGEAKFTCAVRGLWNDGWKDLYLIAFDSWIVLVSLFNSNEFQMEFKFPLDRTTISTTERADSLDLQHYNSKISITFHTTGDLERIRAQVDVYSTVQKRSSGKSPETSTVNLRPNGSRPCTPDSRPSTGGPNFCKSWSRVSRPTSPAPLPPTCQRQVLSMPVFSSKLSVQADKIKCVLPHRRIRKTLLKDPTPALKRGSSARKSKKEVILQPSLADEGPTDQRQYERDLKILKVVELFANLSKQKPRIPVGVPSFASVPHVRVSTITNQSISPMMDTNDERYSSISPVVPVDQSSVLRLLQNDITVLKEQMAKLQTDLHEERKQRRVLQDHLNSLSNANKL